MRLKEPGKKELRKKGLDGLLKGLSISEEELIFLGKIEELKNHPKIETIYPETPEPVGKYSHFFIFTRGKLTNKEILEMLKSKGLNNPDPFGFDRAEYRVNGKIYYFNFRAIKTKQ